MIAFISGHLDITSQEFNEHYVSRIHNAILRNDEFVIGDAKGLDVMAQAYLAYIFSLDSITVYHMFDSPRHNIGKFKTIGGFKTDDERDNAMTINSNYDIAWIRPGRESSGTAKNLNRRNDFILNRNVT